MGLQFTIKIGLLGLSGFSLLTLSMLRVTHWFCWRIQTWSFHLINCSEFDPETEMAPETCLVQPSPKKKLYPEAIPRNSIKHANRMKEWNNFENVYGKVFQAVSIDKRSTRILLTQQLTMFNKNVNMESLVCIIQ